jgi:hypothetical protein
MKAGKTWTSFLDCMIVHLQSVFFPDAAEAVKFYITNTLTLKKPNSVPIQKFFVHTEQLNNDLESLSCLFNRPKVTSATKPAMPLKDADLVTHLM